MYYLKLSGYIPEPKIREFEQTYRLAFTQIPKTCTGYSMSKDTLNEGVFHFISYWDSVSPLRAFAQSSPFLMLVGAYNTLGKLIENVNGEMLASRNGEG